MWQSKININSYKYILTNKSKTQSFLVGLENKALKGLAPLEKIEFEGKDNLKFEYWTAKLISQGEIGLKIEIQKQEEVREESNICKICGRKISPRNKNKICQFCREK